MARRRLTPTEQLERRRQGLCFNCDEPYVPGHVCPRLFYLEAADYVEEDTAAAGLDDLPAPVATEDTPAPAPATTLVVSLHALAGIRAEKTMLLPVMINGERLLALLDTGSTHNFLPESTMRRLALQPTGGAQLRVTVANGDRLRCHGVARNVPITISDEHFTITCAAIDLGCFDFIVDVDFLQTLGSILWDFDALTMTFWRLGRRIRGRAWVAPHRRRPSCSWPRLLPSPSTLCWSIFFISTATSSTSLRVFRQPGCMITAFTFFQARHRWRSDPIVTPSCRRTSWSGSARSCSPWASSGSPRHRFWRRSSSARFNLAN